MAPKRKAVVAEFEYLDGCQEVCMRDPAEFNEHVRLVPVKLLQALEKADEHARVLRSQIMAIPETKNPHYRDALTGLEESFG